METVEHLVKRFVPEHYDIFLNINRKDKSFSGRVAIKGQAIKETIAFHQKDLKIETVLVAGKKVEFEVNHDLEELRFQVEQVGQQELELTFSGHITDGMTGMYPSYYTIDGIKKEVLATQFESHFARQVFPCLDEPAAKATFSLSIKFDQGQGEVVLSNMPEIDIEKRQETGIWSFETTPRMSTYLLAFAIGELQSKLTTTKSGVEVGIFATKAHKSSSLDFALDFAKRVLEFYEDYFGVLYPLKQCYHIALPDFSAGAMENWGLITYREIYLLSDENSTLMSRQLIALVIAHEVAHQWFGNLVTMTWWDDLWLNESFAMMMENLAVDRLEPTWQISNDFKIKEIPSALNRDAIDGIQSVHVAVNHPDEIQTIFDGAIVYSKGSRLMFMLYHWLGEEAFVAGLRDYFEQHQYGNTVGQDLWNALSGHSDKDAASFMESWLEQPGFPVVTAKVENDTLILSQNQFFIGQHEAKGRLWHIPLNSNWSGIPDTLSKAVIKIPNFSQLAAKNKGAFRLNLGNTAHFISYYDGQLQTDLMADLAELDQMSKLQIIQEYRLLAASGLISYTQLLPFLTVFSQESSYPMLSALQGLVYSLRNIIDEGSEAEQVLKQLVIKSFQTSYEQLGLVAQKDEDDAIEKSRHIMLSMLSWANHAEVATRLQEVFNQYADKLDEIPAGIRHAVLSNQLRRAESQSLVDQYLEQYVQTSDGVLRVELRAALALTQSKASLDQLVTSLNNKDIIKPQDLSSWYLALLQSNFAQERLWTWAKENWYWLKKTFAGDMSYADFVSVAAACFKSEERLAEFKAFYEPELSDLALTREIEMGMREIQSRIDQVTKNKLELEQAILAHIRA
ncbi:M1 family metallopeptidase [Streptococcus sp. sy004]|uniref:M1 family metallopeptidase n=1 Tax=Streptococcus sp. sy004 TaxID=2600149 RepID=UPI0011B61AFE|nr:M1 family metallopeptidase [Streptococcus sp. sy004]TWT12386.1 M1 family metallopeptidase [Streptococcus sp. sy004]